MIKFGPAGNSDSFYADGNKASLQMPAYLNKIGLNAYEYQCGKGVKVLEKTAKALGEEAVKNKITLSLHAPYYINLANEDEEKQKNTINYILQSCEASRFMGATRVIIHSGALMGKTRKEAMDIAKITLKNAVDACDAFGYGDIFLCPETMGKINQLGDLDEVMELCQLDDRLIPTIDFGHLNARTLGGLKTYDDFLKIFDTIENKLGIDRLKIFHSHFSKIEYTQGGEKKHLTFTDEVFGPNFEYVGEIVYKKGLTPTFICESAGTQTEDALEMKKIYEGYKVNA